jgi:hypothetical protein
VTDAVEAAGQHVDEEPADELVGCERASRADNIARARELLAVPKPQSNAADAGTIEEPLTLAHPCPCCGGRESNLIHDTNSVCGPPNEPVLPSRSAANAPTHRARTTP